MVSLFAVLCALYARSAAADANKAVSKHSVVAQIYGRLAPDQRAVVIK